jgi:hypothetical protein
MPPASFAPVHLALDAVIVAVTDDMPRVLTVPGTEDAISLPTGPLDLEKHPTLEKGLRDWVEQKAGLKLGYVEQLYTFGDRYRDPREKGGGPRVISAAYLALVREEDHDAQDRSQFRGIYEFLPWEDWRDGRPDMIDRKIRPLLLSFAAQDKRRRERVALTFGLDGAPWDSERTLERYELLWEAGLVAEAQREKSERRSGERRAVESKREAERRQGERRIIEGATGLSMALDHRRMLATALGRLRGKIRYRPVVFELLPPEFTLLMLQRTVEALAGNRLHKQNFRRLVETGGLVERTGRFEHNTRGRPAELFRFRHEVFKERPAPGVYFAGAWWAR